MRMTTAQAEAYARGIGAKYDNRSNAKRVIWWIARTRTWMKVVSVGPGQVDVTAHSTCPCSE